MYEQEEEWPGRHHWTDAQLAHLTSRRMFVAAFWGIRVTLAIFASALLSFYLMIFNVQPAFFGYAANIMFVISFVSWFLSVVTACGLRWQMTNLLQVSGYMARKKVGRALARAVFTRAFTGRNPLD
jgi:hypothetical protein